MNQPTKGQKREFWEWRGFVNEITRSPSLNGFGGDTIYNWTPPDKVIHSKELPVTDLNNLFKWAPKEEIETIQFSWDDDGCHCWLYMKKIVGKPFYGNGLTEEDALFWALWKVKEGL